MCNYEKTIHLKEDTMPEYTLNNSELSVTITEDGAELYAIRETKTNRNYLWDGKPEYWKRRSPILFPIVGSLKNQKYTYNGQEYSMSQHGFARDMKFNLLKKNESEIWFRREADAYTKTLYPFNFTLDIGYRLNKKNITVLWEVTNTGDEVMYFSIGAHPAFLCPIDEIKNQEEYYIGFDTSKPIHYLNINEKGLAVKEPFEEQKTLDTEDGILAITTDLFDKDALIIEENQCHKVSLLTPNKKPYVTVTFDAPLFGLWSPAKKNAPFICIEPWFGRCDSSDFNGNLQDREWGNTLDAGKIFKASYNIEIEDFT